MRIEVIDNNEALLGLQDKWNGLLSGASLKSVFFTWQWQSIWWRLFGQDQILWTLTISTEDGKLIGLAPFFVKKLDDGRRLLQFIGDPQVCDYQDIIVAKGSEGLVYSEVLKFLTEQEREWDLIDLHGLSEHSPTYQIFPSLTPERGYPIKGTIEGYCPVLSLPSNWEDYLKLLSPKDRHELRRKLRRVERQVDSVSWYATSNADSLASDMETFFELHSKSKGKKANFMNGQMRHFFLEIAQAFFAHGWLKLYFLEVEEVKVASMLCFDYNDTIYLYNSGYDPTYSSLSPGLVLLSHCISEAIGRGKKKFDFLRGNERYKYDLGGRDTKVFRFTMEKAIRGKE